MNAIEPMPKSETQQRVLLAHGGGGELMQQLIRERFLPPLANPALSRLTDAALIPWEGSAVVFTTDSYVVTPLFFPGGDIGRLAVCGTVNDLAVAGGEPIAISLGMIMEEGLSLDVLDRVVASIAAAAEEAGVHVVTGDTKVIERRHGGAGESGLLINTAGVGRMRPDAHLDARRIRAGDHVLVSGSIGDHGLAVMSVRNDIEFGTPLLSDVAPLNGMIDALLDSGADVKFMRDATRGGVAGVLADISDSAGLSIELEENRLPIRAATRHAAAMLGLDPLSIANEGKVVCVVAAKDCDRALEVLRHHPYGANAACIGAVTAARPPLVELLTRLGGRRVIQRPYGEDLPRIC